MKAGHILIVLLVALAAGFGGAKLAGKSGGNAAAPAAKAETSYERVMRTGTLRCGYELWDGGMMEEPNSGKVHGPWVDITEALGKAMELKIEWASRVGWGDVAAALKSGKVDANCAGMWQSALKAKQISFSRAFAYQGIEAFVRADDHRFDGDFALLNKPDVKIVTIDNDNGDFIARADFPQARRVALGQLNGTDAELLLHVATGKADVTFTAPGLFRHFDKNNPDKLRRLAPGHYLRAFGHAIVTDNDDPRLMQAIEVGAQEIMNAGMVDKILDKYEDEYPDMYIHAVRPFK